MTTDSPAPEYPLTLRGLPVTRTGYAIGGIVMVLVGGLLVWLGSGYLDGPYALWDRLMVVLALILTIYGLVAAIRGPFMAVVLTEEDAFVRGLFVSRRIRRDQIAGVGLYPSIRWTDEAGRSHSMLVNALNVNRRSMAAQTPLQHIDEAVWMLQAWASGTEPWSDDARLGAPTIR